ncbi:MAG: hypothetical protein K0V04_34715 [Deltaproteobacteria bacterium]|nr:hypothetical protein [Deltaproteobacteria bacterium]
MNTTMPPALPHGELTEVLPDLFCVTGGVKMAPLLAFSRNMTVVREGDRLVLINSMRLDEPGLAALDALGTVTDVIRLAAFHGMDDPFYKDRYDAKTWAVEGSAYRRGFDVTKESVEPYFEADVAMTEQTELPLSGARLHVLPTRPPEGLLRLPSRGGVLVAGDALQNWATTDRYFSFAGKLMMKAMGFIKPHNLGPGWVRAAKPTVEAVRAILDLEFEHVLPAHGEPVIDGAKDEFRRVIEAYAGP